MRALPRAATRRRSSTRWCRPTRRRSGPGPTTGSRARAGCAALTTIGFHRRSRDRIVERYDAAHLARSRPAARPGSRPSPCAAPARSPTGCRGPRALVVGDRLLGDDAGGLRLCPAVVDRYLGDRADARAPAPSCCARCSSCRSSWSWSRTASRCSDGGRAARLAEPASSIERARDLPLPRAGRGRGGRALLRASCSGCALVSRWPGGIALRVGAGRAAAVRPRRRSPSATGRSPTTARAGPGHACLLAAGGDYERWRDRLARGRGRDHPRARVGRRTALVLLQRPGRQPARDRRRRPLAGRT